MSVESIGARVAAIEQHVAEMTGTAPAADSSSSSTFAQALQSAQGTTSPTATAASAPAASGLNAGDPSPYDAQITAAATKYGIDPALLKGLIRQESNFNASARSGAGAQGLTQLMPATAKSLGVDAGDPAQAIDGGARYLKTQLDRFGGDESKALAAYNAGPGAVAKYGGVPPYAETQGYVKSVLAFAAQYRGAGAATDATSALPAALTPSATSALPAATLPVSASSLLQSTAAQTQSLDASLLATGTDDGSDSDPSSTPGVLDYSTI
ncbi:MAG TPA: lytic transglycosylase domain-containing protein [Baekduia sp.]|jgi:soluble lytic murein transglycosylase-like protein